MPVFAEFLLVAFLIYLWESCLWLPKHGLALRQEWFSKKWRPLRPAKWLAARELGLVPLLPLPPDPGLAPCSSLPLAVDETGTVFIATADAGFLPTTAKSWTDFRIEPPHLLVGNRRCRIQSSRLGARLREAKDRGLEPAAAVRQASRRSLSPGLARLELKRWRIVSAPLKWLGPLLFFGFFGGIPAAYVWLGVEPTLWLAFWLWFLMLAIAARLWWLAGQVYPAARKELRMDALLAALVPFHAMRASELASVHAFAGTHPAALVLASGDSANPWLAAFVRELLHPRPGSRGDLALSATLLPSLRVVLERRGIDIASYDLAPDTTNDPEAAAYCPRCHARYRANAPSCGDCGGMALLPVRETETIRSCDAREPARPARSARR